MPKIENCEKCHLLFDSHALTKPDGTTDGQMTKCPRCGHWIGIKYNIDRIKKELEKFKKK